MLARRGRQEAHNQSVTYILKKKKSVMLEIVTCLCLAVWVLLPPLLSVGGRHVLCSQHTTADWCI